MLKSITIHIFFNNFSYIFVTLFLAIVRIFPTAPLAVLKSASNPCVLADISLNDFSISSGLVAYRKALIPPCIMMFHRGYKGNQPLNLLT